jgi:4-hydroxy-3-polyprenylbenzoate decarboxylase
MKVFVVAITGASGSLYGIRLIEILLNQGHFVHLIISSESFKIIHHETNINWYGSSQKEVEHRLRQYYGEKSHFRFYFESDLWAPPSSGSFRTDAMMIVPCSMKTLSGIANGYASNLIERAADVTIKEGRNLIVSPRETPLSTIHLRNMLTLAQTGVKIVPPIPAFYHKPSTLNELIDFVVGKILDAARIEHNLYTQWSHDNKKEDF